MPSMMRDKYLSGLFSAFFDVYNIFSLTTGQEEMTKKVTWYKIAVNLAAYFPVSSIMV